MKQKETVKLKESQLRNIVRESVKNILSELDWKTYDKAARKRYDQWKRYYWRNDEEDKKYFKSYKRLMDAAKDSFDRDYGYSDDDGYLKIDINDNCSDHHIQAHPVKPNGYDFETYSPYFVTNQNFYGQNGQHEPGKWCVGTVGWAGAVAASPDFDSREEAIAYANDNNMRLTPKDKISDKLMSKCHDANNELENFYRYNYDYEKGKGWHLKESRLRSIVKESIKNVLNEIVGWSAEASDFVIVGGNIYPNEQYYYIGISLPNAIMGKFITPYKDYFDEMLYDIKEWVESQGNSYSKTFITMDEYRNELNKTMEEENCDEDKAEYLLSEFFYPVYDYDFAIYAPYGMNSQGPFSGEEIQKKLNALPNRGLM